MKVWYRMQKMIACKLIERVMKLRGIIFNEVEPAKLLARNVKEWFID